MNVCSCHMDITYFVGQKAKESQDLKEMDVAASGLGSTVIQLYWNQTLQCYFNPDVEVRKAAVQVKMICRKNTSMFVGYRVDAESGTRHARLIDSDTYFNVDRSVESRHS